MAKGPVGFFFDAVGHDLASVHDRAREHGAQSGVLNGTDRLEGAVRTRIEKIMLAQSSHAAPNRFDTTEQTARIEMLRAQHAGATIDAPQPGHQLQILPNRAQQDLIQMGMRVDKPRHQDTTAGIDGLTAAGTFLWQTFADLRDKIAVEA